MVKNKYEKGITLVALVITIIVMLILAGVSINAIVGENGIIGRATEAARTQKIAIYQEIISMEVAAAQMDYLNSDDNLGFFNKVQEGLGNHEEFTDAGYSIKNNSRLIITTKDDYIFTVNAISGETAYVGTKEEINSDLPEELQQADIKFEYSTKGWTKDSVKVVISCEKYPTNEIEYSYDLTKWETFTGELSIEENKAIYVRIANEVGATDTYAVGGVGNIDTKAPEIITGITEDESKKTTKGFTVSIEVQDTDEKEENASGIGKVVWYYKVAGTDNFNTYKTTEYVAQNSTTNGSRNAETISMSYDNLPTGNGTYNVYADVYDVAGNVKPTEVIDIELKSVTVSEHNYSPRYWTNGAVTVTLPTVEGCTTKYSIDDENMTSPTDYNEALQITNNCSIYYYVTDGTNIIGTGSQAINNIDATEGTKNPIIVSGLAQEGIATTSTIKTTITVQDTISGFSHIDWYYKLGSSTGEYTKVAMDGADENYMAMNGNNTGKTEQLTISKEFINLQQGEDYEFYAEIYDVAGNKVVSPSNYTTAPLSIRTAQTYVTGIVLSPTSKTINVGEKAQITATVNPSGAKIQTVEWHTSDAGVATVSSTGEVTAVGIGDAQITAKSTDGSNKTSNVCTITVIQPVSGVSLNTSTASVDVGSTVTLTATVSPSNATNKTVTWSTGNSSIATVSNGVVTGVAEGTATITVTTADGNKTASCTVTVNPTYYGGFSGEASTSTNYVGYYADIDYDGTVDGIIYADLRFSTSGTWKGPSDTIFSYTAISNTKTYNVSADKYNGPFGDNYVISPVSNEGSDRFFAMALTDVYAGDLDFYNGASISRNMDPLVVVGSVNDFGQGREKTRNLITAWKNKTYGEQNKCSSHTDMWSLSAVQACAFNEWFVPSKSEWSAFGYNLGVSDSTWETYGLSRHYWTSSIYNNWCAWTVQACYGMMGYRSVNGENKVRLGTTL